MNHMITRPLVAAMLTLGSAAFAQTSPLEPAGTPPISTVPKGGLVDTAAPMPKYDAVNRNLHFDAAAQAQREYESRLRSTATKIDVMPTDPSTVPRTGSYAIPRTGSTNPGAAPYTLINGVGTDSWGATTINMSSQQARDYNERVQAEIGARDRLVEADRNPPVQLNVAPRDMPPLQPSADHAVP